MAIASSVIAASFIYRYRNAMLGALAVVLFFAAWQAIFLVVPLNPLFFTTPEQIAAGFVDLVESGDLFHDLAVSAVPFGLGLGAAVIVGVPLGYSHGLAAADRVCARSVDDGILRKPAGGAGAAVGDFLWR